MPADVRAVDTAVLLEALFDEQRRLWQEGEPILAADYLAGHPTLQADPESAAALIYHEFVLREQRSDEVDIADYLRRFAPYATDLRLLHEADHLVQRMIAAPPRRLGEYELLDEVGRGGMGIVYRARQAGLERVVALKMLLAGELASAADIDRFRNEAQAAGQLQHPNIVAIHDVGVHDGRHFFTMDFVEGKSLADLVRDGPLPPVRAGAYVRVIAEAIHHAHQQGILHRDLKPSNILIDRDDQPRITDFGLAHWMAGKSKLTTTGQVLGTPGYMPPEQASSKCGPISAASDVYALGAILYELLTGRTAVLAETPLDALLQVVENEPVSPRLLNPRVPRDLATICLKCLQKRPHHRYPSAADLADDLGRFLRAEPIQARPIGPAGRLWRWCRRKPLVAALAGAAALFLVAGVLFSLYFAVQEHARAVEADLARKEAKRESATLALERAHRLDEQGEHGRALLWLVRGLELAREAGDPDLEHVARVNLGGAIGQTHRLCAVLSQEGYIEQAAFHPDGRVVALASHEKALPLWSVTGKPLGIVLTARSAFRTVAYHPDGKVILTGHTDGPPHLWQAATGRLLGVLPEHESSIRRVAFSPDGKSFVTADIKGWAQLWDSATRKPRGPRLSCRRETLAVAFSPDSKILFTGGTDNTLRRWDVATGERIDETQIPGWIWSIAFHPDGKSFFTALSNGKVIRWDATTREQMGEPIQHTGPVFSVAVSPDGKTILTSSQDRTARLWDSGTHQPLGNPLAHQDRVWAAVFSPDGRAVLTGSGDGTGRVWEIATPRPENLVLPHKQWVCSVRFSPDGRALLTSCHDAAVWRWDTTTGKPTGNPLRLEEPVGWADPSPDGRSVLAVFPNPPGVWDAVTARLLFRIAEVNVVKADFAPDGKTFLTASTTAGAALWDAGTGRLLQRLGHAGGVQAIAYRPDGTEVATGGLDGKARRWHVATGQSIGPDLAHPGEVLSVAYRQDGKVLLTGSADAVARLWDLATGQLLGQPFSATRAVAAVAFSPDGKMILTGSSDGRAQLWDVATGLPLGQPLVHSRAIRHVAFSPDGKKMATASEDHTARIWPVPQGVRGEPRQIRRNLQTGTGLALDQGGRLYVLDPATWAQGQEAGRAGESEE
jgi:WD40 repeat protein/tRNA A-37 threonylcarbamoyl transferase component Bud32